MRILGGIAVLTALLAGCGKTPGEPAEARIQPLAERQPAPPFELKDATGAVATLEDYKGKILLLNFWATWCAPCKAEIPWFQEFESKFSARGFHVLGVSLDEEGWEVVKPYIEERKITYRMVIGNEQVSTLYGGIDSLPTTFLIDRDGKIAAIHTGLVNKATYQKEIEQLLEAPPHARALPQPGPGQLAWFRVRHARAE
jgi:cytochrome c biogenesis protein CcmG/thiol:disulfide interchange protein DsbE